jgi:phosphoribosyl-AMP cyclohydrolase / phosphoribosyl-ATP pyrophosphohydrolase
MNLDVIKFNDDGLVPAIIQDASTLDVLMLAYMNKESLEMTLNTQEVTFYSRSRKALWKKGETSGHTQTLKSLRYDCDEDTLLLLVEQKGVACHTLQKSCFHRAFGEEIQASANVLDEIYATVKDRAEYPMEGSYTQYLLTQGLNKTLKKVGEESAEVIIAAKEENEENVINEVSDLLYHLTVMLYQKDIALESVYTQLKNRQGKTHD